MIRFRRFLIATTKASFSLASRAEASANYDAHRKPTIPPQIPVKS